MYQQSICAFALLVIVAGCSSSSDPAAAPAASKPHRKAYVGLFGDQSVAVLDTVNNQVLKTIPVSAPDGLIVTPNGKKVYVSSTDTGTVKVIETANATPNAVRRPAVLTVHSCQASTSRGASGHDHRRRQTRGHLRNARW